MITNWNISGDNFWSFLSVLACIGVFVLQFIETKLK